MLFVFAKWPMVSRQAVRSQLVCGVDISIDAISNTLGGHPIYITPQTLVKLVVIACRRNYGQTLADRAKSCFVRYREITDVLLIWPIFRLLRPSIARYHVVHAVPIVTNHPDNRFAQRLLAGKSVRHFPGIIHNLWTFLVLRLHHSTNHELLKNPQWLRYLHGGYLETVLIVNRQESRATMVRPCLSS